MNNSELLPIVNEVGSVIGCAERERCHGGEKILHPVVHLHVVRDGKLLLQHRSKLKTIQPGKWDTAVGGHVSYGETIEEALRREVAEEIGLKGFSPTFIKSYLFESEVERELINVFITRVSSEFVPHTDETDIDEFGFFTPDEIDGLIDKGLTTPNFAQEYQNIVRNSL